MTTKEQVAKRTVILAIKEHGRVAVTGLTPSEEDSLYEVLEQKYGKCLTAITGRPYTIHVAGRSGAVLHEELRRYCERKGMLIQ